MGWCHQGYTSRGRPSGVQMELVPHLTPPQLLPRWRESGVRWREAKDENTMRRILWRETEDGETDTAREGEEGQQKSDGAIKRGGSERGTKKEGLKVMCQQQAPERCKIGREETFDSTPLPAFPPPSPPPFSQSWELRLCMWDVKEESGHLREGNNPARA